MSVSRPSRAMPWVLALVAAGTLGASELEYEERRMAMVETVVNTGSGYADVDDEAVLEAMRTVPRHKFVPEGSESVAYVNRPLPIGHGQTISQPYIVALMTQLLDVDEDDKVLEIGTGSGYQAAVLAELVDAVYTIEIVEPLAEQAAARFESMGMNNVHAKHGDGYHGWPDHGPFDGIIVTAAASHIPPPLVEQLKPGGRMVIPVGAPLQAQTLLLVEKDKDGKVTQRSILPVQFVPFTRGSDNG